MASAPIKPQGRTGAIQLSETGAIWKIIPFPPEKSARELMIGEMFVRCANRLMLGQSAPSYAPFSELVQNKEADLDFTLQTAFGSKLMEIAEFAPLAELGHRFADAPKELGQDVKSDLALKLIGKKSGHQGGQNRLLLLYTTEKGFWLDPLSIELLRRALAAGPPAFERVYYVSPSDTLEGGVWEIFPGRPHHSFGEIPTADLREMRAMFPHPEDMLRGTRRFESAGGTFISWSNLKP